MTCSLRILSTRTIDSSPAILLVAPNGSKTLVNCGEGCQRVFLEFGQKLATVNRVCLTHFSHSTLGGLPGMILTSADVMTNSAIAVAKHRAEKRNAGHLSSVSSKMKRPLSPTEDLPGLDVLGPRGIDAFIHSLRHFMRRDAFRLRVHAGEYKQPSPPTKPAKRQKASKSNGSSEEGDFQVEMVVCETELGRQALSYVFTTPPVPGKFLIQKAMELGIPKGPLYAQLKKGEAVTFTNPKTGKECTVESSEVVEQGFSGVAVIVLYYPTLHVLHQLIASEALIQLLRPKDSSPHGKSLPTESPEVDLIVHATSQQCFESQEGSEWRSGMNKNIEHLLMETRLPTKEEDPGTPFHSTAAGALCRSSLFGDLFVAPDEAPEQQNLLKVAKQHVRRAVPLLEYTLIPRAKKGFGNDHYHYQHRRSIDENMMNVLHGSGAVDLVRKTLPNPSTSSADGAEILFTGTGSAIPCKHRNVSGIYLQMTNKNGILLDVGEGTIGQLSRAKQSVPLETILRRLCAVWISHPHADHHLGILRLLADRARCLAENCKPLILIAPSVLQDFLFEYESLDSKIIGSYSFLDCDRILKRSRTGEQDASVDEILQRLKDELEITGIHSTPVHHCAHSYAVTLHGTSFGTVAYSGDCRPSRNFAADALNADLLIHEATFTDGMEAEANLKRHSTVGEALDIASRMRAKSVILTHFSQRFPKIPPVSSTAGQEPCNEIPVIFAFDYMRVTPDNLVAASKITPALRLLYPEESTIEESDEAYPTEIEPDASVLDTPGMFAQKELL